MIFRTPQLKFLLSMIYQDPLMSRNFCCILPQQQDQSIFRPSLEGVPTDVSSGMVCHDLVVWSPWREAHCAPVS